MKEFARLRFTKQTSWSVVFFLSFNNNTLQTANERNEQMLSYGGKKKRMFKRRRQKTSQKNELKAAIYLPVLLCFLLLKVANNNKNFRLF
jgi:hypothetical protein